MSDRSAFQWTGSIRWRAALLTGTVLLVVLGVFIGYTYRAIGTLLVSIGTDRAHTGAAQIGDLLARATQQRSLEMSRAAANPLIRQWLEAGRVSPDEALARLKPLITGTQHQSLELWTADGKQIVNLLQPAKGNTLPPGAAPTRAGILPIRTAPNGGLVTELVTEVRDGEDFGGSGANVIGYLVNRRVSAPAAATPELLNRLVGSGATVLVGNADGSLWSDLNRVVEGPRLPANPPRGMILNRADGTKAIGGFARIADTPWAVWIDFPYDLLVRPARSFLSGLSTIGLVFIVLSSVAIWMLSARVTRPLNTLADAAAAIAGGDYSRRVVANRRSEVGELGRTFNRMAEQVQAAHMTLESRARESRESELRKSAVMNGALDSILTMERDGTITEFNAAAERMFACARAEVLGRNLLELVSLPATSDNPGADFAKHASLNHGARIEMSARRRSGETFPAEVSIVATRIEHGEFYSAFIRDLTDQKSAEQARVRSVQLEEENRRVQEASRLKSEFLANMSHELRTPLNSIIGFAQLLHDGEVTPDMPQFREFIGDILSSGQHLLQLINDVLDLSKVEAGRLDFHPEPLNLDQAITDVVNILRTASSQKQLRITSHVEDDARAVVLDRARLKQVLYNYLSNAIKFTPEGGSIAIDARGDGDTVHIDVSDSGIGIAPEDLPKLFVEFNQLEGGVAKKHQGTGLGLALTKRLAEAQGGYVSVRSTVGKGSTFSVVLPKHTTARSTVLAPKSIPGRRAGAPSVLVIEDSKSDQDALVKTLVHAGFAVETATTAAQAMAKIDSRKFDAITLDLILPDANGTDILRHLRSCEQNRDVPVIVVTVVALDGAVAGFAVHDILPKPSDPQQLLESLRRAGVSARESGHVLVVDDDHKSLRLMAALLDQAGYRSHCVSNGVDGLAYCRQTTPAALVLDLQMPQMDGFEFLVRFRDLPNCRTTPVFVWTVQDLTSDDYDRLKSGVNGILSKGQTGNSSVVDELRRFVPQQERA